MFNRQFLSFWADVFRKETLFSCILSHINEKYHYWRDEYNALYLDFNYLRNKIIHEKNKKLEENNKINKIIDNEVNEIRRDIKKIFFEDLRELCFIKINKLKNKTMMIITKERLRYFNKKIMKFKKIWKIHFLINTIINYKK